MSKKAFGTTSKGVEASLYEISNGGGLRVLLTDYGASVVSIFVKDKDGNERDVILGYDNVKSYEKEYCYFGATVGRYANRISDAKVNIDGVEYKLEANDNENSLHSGSNGFSKRFWTVKEQKADEITFEIEDADLEQELCDSLQKLYEKYVPSSVREYIDEGCENAPATASSKKQKEKEKAAAAADDAQDRVAH